MCDRRIIGLRQIVVRARTIRPVQTVPPEPSFLVRSLFIFCLLLADTIFLTARRYCFRCIGTQGVNDVRGRQQFVVGRECQCQGSSRFDGTTGDGEDLRQRNQYRLEGSNHRLATYDYRLDYFEEEINHHCVLVRQGYRDELMDADPYQSAVPVQLVEKADVLFGNLPEICAFHGQILLPDLESSLSSPQLVASCFLRHVRDARKRVV